MRSETSGRAASSKPRRPAPRKPRTQSKTACRSTSAPNRSAQLPYKIWCTGEDSNLRSSQGAADLQSAAINHSATCAHSTELSPRKKRGGIASLSAPSANNRCRRDPDLLSKNAVTKLRPQNSATAARSTFRAHRTNWKAAAGFSSLGELRVSFGLLLLRLAARSWLRSWSWRRDLNPRPSDYKSDALPAELRQPARLDTSASNHT